MPVILTFEGQNPEGPRNLAGGLFDKFANTGEAMVQGDLKLSNIIIRSPNLDEIEAQIRTDLAQVEAANPQMAGQISIERLNTSEVEIKFG